MPPPVESWDVRELPDRVLGDGQGRRRKGFNGDLRGCELLEMLQYTCEVEKPVTKQSKTICWPLVRLFRR
jgi:hypothetical protein